MPYRLRLRETVESENAISEMVRERYGEAYGKEVSGLELRRTHRRCSPIGHIHSQMDAIFSPSRHRMFDHSASDEPFLFSPSCLSHRFLACGDMIVLFNLSE